MLDNNTYRKSARIVGVLFILTMIVGMLDAYLVAPVLSSPIIDFSLNKNLMISGAILILVLSLGIVGIAIMLFPVLKRYNQTVAFTYLSFRILECVFLIVGAIIYLFLLELSQAYIKAGTPNDLYLQTIGTLAIKLRYDTYQIAMLILGVCSLMLCYLFFQSKLIPRWLSVWGFVGYALLLSSAILDLLNVIDTVNGAGIVMYFPGLLFELIVFPTWLIGKGFHFTAGGIQSKA